MFNHTVTPTVCFKSVFMELNKKEKDSFIKMGFIHKAMKWKRVLVLSSGGLFFLFNPPRQIE